MIKRIYCVHDSKAELYNNPVLVRSVGEATREFKDLVNKPDHPFSQHPGDFHLFELGTFDDNNAQFEIHQIPINMGCALEYLDNQQRSISQSTHQQTESKGLQ